MGRSNPPPDPAGLGTPRPGHLRLLGRFELHYGSQHLHPAPSEQRLIALLGLKDEPLGRPCIAGTLWPRAQRDKAAGRLRSAVHRLRKLEPELLDTGGSGRLGLSDSVAVDTRVLASWARNVISDVTTDEHLMPSGVDRGDGLLPGWNEDWVILERERLRQLRSQALEAVTVHLTDTARHAEAVKAGRAAVDAGPLRESARRALICAYASARRLDAAAHEYGEYGRLLERELGLTPSPQLQELMTSLMGPSRTGDTTMTARR